MTAERIVDAFLPLEEALQRLVGELDNLESLPADPDENPDNEDPFFDERAQIMATVAHVAMFMQSLPELAGKERERPLITLLHALVDVQGGRKSKLFSPGRKRGRKKPAHGDRYARARYAAAMEFFTLVDGYTNEQAARRVARHLDSNGNAHLFHDRTEHYEQVESWRENVTGSVNTDAARHYRALVACGKAAGFGPEETAKRLLKSCP